MLSPVFTGSVLVLLRSWGSAERSTPGFMLTPASLAEKSFVRRGGVVAELKTKETAESVSAFLDKIADKGRREDCRAVVDIMRDVTKEEPKMWGSSIVGFGRYRRSIKKMAAKRIHK
jgi:hypothetical protein